MKVGEGVTVGDAVKVEAIVGVGVLGWKIEVVLHESTAILIPKTQGTRVSLRFEFLFADCFFIENLSRNALLWASGHWPGVDSACLH